MPKIEEMYAFVAEENGPEDEGIIGLSAGKWILPLVGADMDRVTALRPYAQDIANRTGKKIKLIHFTNRVEMEEICPVA
jgi:hypothetical protein